MRTKINANIGTSKDKVSIDEEMEKLEVLVKYGADAVMDLSTGGPIKELRKMMLKNLLLQSGQFQSMRLLFVLLKIKAQ